jgi:hypothetical protein
MRPLFRILRDILLGSAASSQLEEESYPRGRLGRPDLSHFTKPLEHYTRHIDDYLMSLGPTGPRDAPAQSLAYRKGVIGQWGVIARAPAQALPYVLQLLRKPVAEGRRAAAGILDDWATDATFVPQLLSAADSEQDIETLSVLVGTVGRLRARAALPLLASLLRSPDRVDGDLGWSVIDAIADGASRSARPRTLVSLPVTGCDSRVIDAVQLIGTDSMTRTINSPSRTLVNTMMPLRKNG